MRKIILYISATIDMQIASNEGTHKWLADYPNPDKKEYGWKESYKDIDVLIMGGKTYRSIQNMGIGWPYGDKVSYVITRQNREASNDQLHFINEEWIEKIRELKKEEGKDIWLVGGSEILSILLKEKLIDKMIIVQYPILLGPGIPLFQGNQEVSMWSIIRHRIYENGILYTEYSRH